MRLYGQAGTYTIRKYWVMAPGSTGMYLYEVVFKTIAYPGIEILLIEGLQTPEEAEAYVTGHSRECEVKSITFPKQHVPDGSWVPITKLSDIR
jgi:hypothetical protein